MVVLQRRKTLDGYLCRFGCVCELAWNNDPVNGVMCVQN
jgi:hypothetical protein